MSSVTLINYSQQPPTPEPTTKLGILLQKSKPMAEPTDSLEYQIAYCARVSNPSNQNADAPTKKLLNYLLEHKHFSPFEMVSACLEIETTRDIARQILRHRSFSFQEFSQRYANPTKDLGFTTKDARLQDSKNRQNSTELDTKEFEHRELVDMWEQEQELLLDQAIDTYNWAIENGIAKEQARAVLPEGMTNSRMYMNGTLRSWIHYIELRTGPETQKEHRIIAQQCAKALEPIFPNIMQFSNIS